MCVEKTCWNQLRWWKNGFYHLTPENFQLSDCVFVCSLELIKWCFVPDFNLGMVHKLQRVKGCTRQRLGKVPTFSEINPVMHWASPTDAHTVTQGRKDVHSHPVSSTLSWWIQNSAGCEPLCRSLVLFTQLLFFECLIGLMETRSHKKVLTITSPKKIILCRNGSQQQSLL